MAIMLTALQELVPFYVVTALALAFLWVSHRRTKVITLDWVAKWEARHRTGIETLLRSCNRVLRLSGIVTWSLPVVMIFLIILGWDILSSAATGEISQYPPHVQRLAVGLVKVLFLLPSGAVLISLASLSLKVRARRLREMLNRRPGWPGVPSGAH